MKKYIVYNTKQGSKDGLILSGYDRMKVQEEILDMIEDHNDSCLHEKDKISIFDYTFAAVPMNPKDITDFDIAREFLGGKPNMDYTVTKKLDSNNLVKLEDVTHLVRDLNPIHVEVLIAMNELLTLAQAWRRAFIKQDHPGLEYSNTQWQPTFTIAKDNIFCTGATENGMLGKRLSFPTKGCATAFGHKFIDLFRKVML